MAAQITRRAWHAELSPPNFLSQKASYSSPLQACHLSLSGLSPRGASQPFLLHLCMVTPWAEVTMGRSSSLGRGAVRKVPHPQDVGEQGRRPRRSWIVEGTEQGAGMHPVTYIVVQWAGMRIGTMGHQEAKLWNAGSWSRLGKLWVYGCILGSLWKFSNFMFSGQLKS